MTGNIFINYRRDDSGHFAGRLHDRMEKAFGSHKLFMDVDNIPVGRDFTEYLKSQVAACDAMLSIIGPNWLSATDENGQRRVNNPNDFVVIEIATALARDIPVVPVLIDGARMPRESELPDSLKPLTRRNAVQVHRDNFGSDAEALVRKLREALGDGVAGSRRWRLLAVAGAVALFLIVTGGIIRHFVDQGVQEAELKSEQASRAEPDANGRVQQAEQQRLAAAETEAKRKTEQPKQIPDRPPPTLVGTWRSSNFAYTFYNSGTYIYIGALVTEGMHTDSSEKGTYRIDGDKLTIQRESGILTTSLNNYRQDLTPQTTTYYWSLVHTPNGLGLQLTFPNGGSQTFLQQ
jgi:hypothetical protein